MPNFQPQGIAPGIYFNLSNDDYHNDPALSHSGMTKILVSWQDYWIQSCHNPDRKKWEQTDAMKFGERSGMLLLEPKKFHEKFNTYGRSKPGSKGVWLSSVEYTKLHESIDCIIEEPVARDHFVEGYPEVSIFWPDPATGVMLRARIDYLRTFGAIDFKRIKGVDNWGIGRAVKDQGLDIQNFLYLEAIKAAREMLRKMKDYQRQELAQREGVDLDWLNAFMDDDDLLFRFLFQRSASPFIWEFRELEPEALLDGGNATYVAIKRFKAAIERYGTGRPPMGSPIIKTISQHHIPRRDYDYDQN